MEERVRFLSQTCVDLKEKATQENEIASLNSEIATFRAMKLSIGC